MNKDFYTVGDIHRMTGLNSWPIRRTIDRLGIGQRLGQYRVIRREDLDKVLASLPAGAGAGA